MGIQYDKWEEPRRVYFPAFGMSERIETRRRRWEVFSFHPQSLCLGRRERAMLSNLNLACACAHNFVAPGASPVVFVLVLIHVLVLVLIVANLIHPRGSRTFPENAISVSPPASSASRAPERVRTSQKRRTLRVISRNVIANMNAGLVQWEIVFRK